MKKSILTIIIAIGAAIVFSPIEANAGGFQQYQKRGFNTSKLNRFNSYLGQVGQVNKNKRKALFGQVENARVTGEQQASVNMSKLPPIAVKTTPIRTTEQKSNEPKQETIATPATPAASTSGTEVYSPYQGLAIEIE